MEITACGILASHVVHVFNKYGFFFLLGVWVPRKSCHSMHDLLERQLLR